MQRRKMRKGELREEGEDLERNLKREEKIKLIKRKRCRERRNAKEENKRKF